MQVTQKVVLSLDLHEDKKCKKKVMNMASSVTGVDSISVKEKQLTLIGTMDPIEVVSRLRKSYRTEVVSIGPAKEPEKPKDEPKNEIQVVDYWAPAPYSYHPPCYPTYSYYWS